MLEELRKTLHSVLTATSLSMGVWRIWLQVLLYLMMYLSVYLSMTTDNSIGRVFAVLIGIEVLSFVFWIGGANEQQKG